ncbi:beta-1,4-galactosyltransferase 1-like [Sinocyclocheilus rhinocerous]|uniref:Beta-1,4-galactosyltransferase n=1 Tax=Sinocyclocheilus rhinocerous TaxID=307959 RepID=A0A673GXF0_9TELE|nr:PREDICTED: beta-1,4-galactosyltransferase 1-like [Sinocyclocheilus rhinocerous]XP_016432224.1 PREDICTED: beta-1,4-galactosyltransferase 1-like [Sinocyclocheilus rhinocerous]
MKESVLLNVGFFTKSCVVLVCLCGVHLIVALFFYLTESPMTFTNYRLIQSDSDQFNSQTHSTAALGIQYDNGTEVDVNKLIYTNGSVIKYDVVEEAAVLESCPETSPLLVGLLRVEFSEPVNLDMVRKGNPQLVMGGRYKPSDCLALQKVAIIIPFRNRGEHLKYWLHYLHPILQRQQLDYGIYVIQQDGEDTFNRAKLLNVGYAEALKEYDYDCFIFSDVDIIPMDDRNTYKCSSQPRHLSVSMDKFGFRLPYKQYFGGVSAISIEQFQKINGFPNNYWGWGGEDDDIFNRLVFRGMKISRPSGDIGKCRMIRHSRDTKNEPNPQRFKRIVHTRQTMNTDGIKSLRYKVIDIEKDQLFTKITVDIGKP